MKLATSVAFVMVFVFGVAVIPSTLDAAGVTAEEILRNTDTQRRLQEDERRIRQELAAAQQAGDEKGAKSAQEALKAITDALSKMGQGIMDSNFQCVPVRKECKCGMIQTKDGCKPGPNKYQCTCRQPTPVGAIPGVCVENLKCEGQSAPDQRGQQQSPGNSQGFQDILKSAMGILQQLMQQGQQQQQQQPFQTQGCQQYYQVSTPTADPCAYYVPPTSSSLLTNTTGSLDTGVSDALLNALGSGSNINVSDQLFGALTPQPSGTTPTPASPGTAPGPVDGTLATQAVNLQAGAQGDIQITPAGATIIARARDAQANTEVAGFYGSPTIGGEQPQSLVARLCRSRPWATSVVTYIIPPSFFDSLCAWRGYQVGTPAPPPSPVVVQQVRPTPPPASSTSTMPTVAPEVDIWAVPAKVPLGARTSVFWNTKGVESCTITSPDGSFEEHSLSGGAATVALSGPTTFTISCLTPGGQPVTDYVTVNLTI